MARLAFLADVHVKRGYVSAVRSNGFQIVWIDDEAYDRGEGPIQVYADGRRGHPGELDLHHGKRSKLFSSLSLIAQ